jgi:hypothetical protein
MEADSPFIRLPEGVADPACQTGFVSTADGIAKIDLNTGGRVWVTTAADRPLAFSGDRLLALRRAPEAGSPPLLVAIDTSAAPQAIWSSPLEAVPSWTIHASGAEFHIDATIVGNALVLSWTARTAYTGGAPPPERILAERAAIAGGAVRVDLSTGAMLPPAARASTPPSHPGEFEDAGGEWRTPPWRAGAEIVSLGLIPGPTGQVLTLEISTRGERIELTRGLALVADVSLDGRHVLVRDEGVARSARDWKVFAIEQRRQIADITHEPGAREATVCAHRLIYRVKRVARAATPQAPGTAMMLLAARDLDQDIPLWECVTAEVASRSPRLRP